MVVRLAGYALWYDQRFVEPRDGVTRRLVNRVLLDLESGLLRPHESSTVDAVHAQMVISPVLSELRACAPALSARLQDDLTDAIRAGGTIDVVRVRFVRPMPPARGWIRLASYQRAGERVVFWMSARPK